MRFILASMIGLLALEPTAHANPYWNPQRVPTDSSYRHPSTRSITPLRDVAPSESAINVLRVQVDWNAMNETYQINKTVIEPSGTPGLLARSAHKPRLGSYLGVLKTIQTGVPVYYDSIGTGKEYRKLVRSITLRFPQPLENMQFELYAENPQTGIMEKVLVKTLDIQSMTYATPPMSAVEVKELAQATQSPSIRINIYAEGYKPNEKALFWKQAVKTVQALQNESFPGIAAMSFYGVFSPSKQKLGAPRDLGMPVPEYNSFLGLFFPYWDPFGRWYDVVYPTREDKLRQGLAVAPYDYAIILSNDSGYWGIGNYMAYTAIPAGNSSYFTYLLLHEFGHFFGLNEEYEGGGRTELEFAPEINEPWSQNITFFADEHYDQLKWSKWVSSATPLPTPYSVWQSSPPVYGAYVGGYADSYRIPGHQSYKPGFNCVMENQGHFCEICQQAISEVVQFSLGQ